MNKIIGDYILQDVYLRTKPRIYNKCIRKNESQSKSYSSQTIKKPPNIPNLKTSVNQAKNIQSPNVLSHYDYFETANNYYVFTQFCNEGTLNDIIQKGQMSEEDAQGYLRQILNGLKSLHEEGICDVDLNPQSIFINNGVLKIGQINLASSVIFTLETDQSFQNFGSCKELNAPEVLEGQPSSIYSDLYVVGLLYYRLLFGRFPFEASTRTLLITQMLKSLQFENLRKISSQSQDFLKRILVYDARLRLKWSDVYKHDLLKLLNISETGLLEQSILVSRISINKVISLSDLNTQPFDILQYGRFYIQNENQQKQEQIRNTQIFGENTGLADQEQYQDELRFQQALDQVFFMEQIQENFKCQVEFFITQRNLYARLCKSVGNIRLLSDETSYQVQLEFLVMKAIFILAKLLNQGMEKLKPLALQLVEINQDELILAFVNLNKQIDMEFKVIDSQFEQCLGRVKNRLQYKNDFQQSFLVTINDQINYEFILELQQKIQKYPAYLIKTKQAKIDLFFTNLHLVQLNIYLILFLLFILNKQNMIDTIFEENCNIYIANLSDQPENILLREGEKNTQLLNALIKQL